MSTVKKTTGEVIAESLVMHGVDTLFGIPGAHMYDFNDATARQKGLKFIVNRHEQGSGYMAYGYAKSTGKVGAYTVVPGPGLLNSGAALSTAYGSNTPVLCITGNIMSHLIGQGRGQLHELPDQLALIKGLTKWSERINHPTEAFTVMAEAFKQLQSGRPRPVAVETPWDVFGMEGHVEMGKPMSLSSSPEPNPDAIKEAAKLLSNSKNPLIMVGGGALEAGEQVLELAKLLQAPVTAHRSGKGIVGEDLPYGMSFTAAYEYWKNTDVLIGIGSRLELQYFRWQWFPKDIKIIRIDIDPTEMVRLKPDVSIVSDATKGTACLFEELLKQISIRPKREEEFISIKETVLKKIQSVQPQMSYLNVIREVLPKNGFFVEEVSQVGFTSRFGFPVYEPRKFVTGGYQDNLGFGFNTALGVKVAHPNIPVVAVCGDGGFLFGAQELATAVQYNINLITIVFNNSSYGNVRRDQINRYNSRIQGADLINPDFVKLAESFGALGLKVKTPEELKLKLDQAFKADCPVVIEVQVKKDSEVSPWSFIHPKAP